MAPQAATLRHPPANRIRDINMAAGCASWRANKCALDSVPFCVHLDMKCSSQMTVTNLRGHLYDRYACCEVLNTARSLRAGGKAGRLLAFRDWYSNQSANENDSGEDGLKKNRAESWGWERQLQSELFFSRLPLVSNFDVKVFTNLLLYLFGGGERGGSFQTTPLSRHAYRNFKHFIEWYIENRKCIYIDIKSSSLKILYTIIEKGSFSSHWKLKDNLCAEQLIFVIYCGRWVFKISALEVRGRDKVNNGLSFWWCTRRMRRGLMTQRFVWGSNSSRLYVNADRCVKDQSMPTAGASKTHKIL